MRVAVSIEEQAPYRFSLGEGELALEALEAESRDYDWKDQRITASLQSPSVAARERFLEALARAWNVSLPLEGREACCTTAKVCMSATFDTNDGRWRSLFLGGPGAPEIRLDWQGTQAFFSPAPSNTDPDPERVMRTLAALLREGRAHHPRVGFSAPILHDTKVPRVTSFTSRIVSETPISWVQAKGDQLVVIQHGAPSRLLCASVEGDAPRVWMEAAQPIRAVFVRSTAPLHARWRWRLSLGARCASGRSTMRVPRR